MKDHKKKSSIKVRKLNNKFIIEGGKCYTQIHIPGRKDPLIMSKIRYYIVTNQNTLEFAGASNKFFTVAELVDANETARRITIALEQSRNSFTIIEEAFYDSKQVYALPALSEIFTQDEKEQKYPLFKKHVGLLIKEWDDLHAGVLPSRLNTTSFMNACAEIWGKPKDCPLNCRTYWQKIISNEKIERAAEVI